MNDKQIDQLLNRHAEQSLRLDMSLFEWTKPGQLPKSPKALITSWFYRTAKNPVYLNDDKTGNHATQYLKEYEEAAKKDREAIDQRKKHPGNVLKLDKKYTAMAQKTIDLHYEFVPDAYHYYVPPIIYDKSKLP